MKVLFYDTNFERLNENFEYFSNTEDTVFITIKDISMINKISQAADFVILYDSDKTDATEYICNNLYLISDANDTDAMPEFFSNGAKIIYNGIKTHELYKFLKKEYIKVSKMKGDLTALVNSVMKNLQIPAHLCGYDYITEAIYLCYNDPSVIYSLTKQLYPCLSKRFKTTANNIERSIRHAIEQGFDTSNSFYVKIFNVMPKQRPTNKVFLKAVITYINNNI